MATPPKLRLLLTDVYGKFIGQNVDVTLKHQGLSDLKNASAKASGPIEINGLEGAPQGLYKMEIYSLSYQPVVHFVNMRASGITEEKVTMAVNPDRVLSVNFPKYNALPQELKDLLDRSDEVAGYIGSTGKCLYDALMNDPVRCAGLLNIATKCRVTKLTGGKTVLPALGKIRDIRGDRFFVDVTQDLRDDTKNSIHEKLFHPADGSLHHMEDGFEGAGSFKTPDHYGNLQLTFFCKGESWRADVDIDDAAGIEHVFQVLGNALGGSTNPYNIHEILVGYQHNDPGYTFNL